MHHNAAGYSGTDGNAVWVHHNNFYDNALGFTTDVFTAAGHPGFPQDSDLVEHNNFYSNNFNPYVKGSDVEPRVPFPVGTGLWIAGGNNNIVRNNHFWDNWRRGTMLFAVPDAFVCGPAPEQPGRLRPATSSSTSYRNRFYGNVMGRDAERQARPQRHRLLVGQLPRQHRQLLVRQHRQGRQQAQHHEPCPMRCRPTARRASAWAGRRKTELVGCVAAPTGDPSTGCPWFTTPPEPK